MYNEIASLLTMQLTTAANGDQVEDIISERSVFCRIYSAGEKETTAAATRGKTAEIIIEMPDSIEYSNEQFCRVRGAIYEVVDTKFGDTSDKIRLVLTRWAYR